MATTTTSTANGYSTTDAGYRVIGSSINAAIAAVGLVQASDTDQINWTTVLRPTVAFSSAGYEMWRFNDSLQSTSPVYLKIEYSAGSNANYMHIAITVGTGTNGAGILTGNISQRMQMYSTVTEANSVRTSYFSGSTNRLAVCLWPGVMSGQWFVFGLERTHDASGADTGDGVYILASSYSVLGFSQYLPLGATTPLIPPATIGSTGYGLGWYCSAPLTGSGALGADYYTYPIKTFNMYETLPCFNFAHYMNVDITAGTTITINGYDGNNRTYYATGMINSTISWFALQGSSLAVSVLMRYD